MLGHRVAVTGGGSGIGEATCRLIACAGGKVAVLGRTLESIQRVADECEGVAVQVDVADPDSMQQALTRAADLMGGLTALCNNAGTGTITHLHETSSRTWNRILAVNLGGVFNAIRVAAPLMLAGDGGAIVNVASISALRPAPGEAAYAASKAGVVALSAAAAAEYAPTIRVNCVSPGVVSTNLTAPMLESNGDILRAAIPLERVGTSPDVAELIVFLLSHRAAWITGQNFVVDGGTTLHGSGIESLARNWLREGR